MKYYLLTTGVTFGLIVAAHLLRISQEGSWLLGEPIFLFTSFLSIAFCIWAIVLLNKLRRIGKN
jgi:hypothetical protein